MNLETQGDVPTSFDDETTEELWVKAGVEVTGYDAHKKGAKQFRLAIVV